MTLMTDLFEFAYVPGWYGQLDSLAEMALPEPWRFRNPVYSAKNPDNPILERYLHATFRKQSIDFNNTTDQREADKTFHVRNEYSCFHTGLYNRHYKPIYACFDRNKKLDSTLTWYLRGFADDVSPWLKHVDPLPDKPSYFMPQYGVNYCPDWPIRVNIEHILHDPDNYERIPDDVKNMKNLPLLLETAVELARRRAIIEPGIVVPQYFHARVQYLLPVYLTSMDEPDLAMTLTIMDGYYLGNTCLTPEMAYLNARLLSKPVAPWLTALTN